VRLACFEPPSEVARAVQAEFGLTLPRQQVAFFDPTTAEGARLGPALREAFFGTRAECLRRLEQIPLYHRAVRLRLLQQLLDQHGQNPVLALRLLDLAAKEMGGHYERGAGRRAARSG
jgi:hypothetical protein